MEGLVQSRGRLQANLWRDFRVVFYYTSSRTQNQKDTLSLRISRAGDPKASMVPIINQWVEEGKPVKIHELQRFVKQLRRFRRYKHSLEVLDWLTTEKNRELTKADIAIRLDLVYKVHGQEEADKYFDSIQDEMRSSHVYGALLNCYARGRHLDKAEATMEKMRQLGFLNTSLNYNNMLHLYSRLRQHEKVEILFKEMDEKGIKYDVFTYNIRLNAFVSLSDFEGMEKFLQRMESDQSINKDYHSYVVATTGYLKAGATEKSLQMLKKAEQLIDPYPSKKRFAYEILLTLYAACGRKDEVYRVWNLYKKIEKFRTSGYISMVSSLSKLGDIDGAEKIFNEWESNRAVYDVRLPNLLVSAYCKNGLLGKAEAYVHKLVESGEKPNAFMFHTLAMGYQNDNQMGKAVEALKTAVLADEPGLRLNRVTLAACLEYLNEHEGAESVQELQDMLRERGHLVLGTLDTQENDDGSGTDDASNFGQVNEEIDQDFAVKVQ